MKNHKKIEENTDSIETPLDMNEDIEIPVSNESSSPTPGTMNTQNQYEKEIQELEIQLEEVKKTSADLQDKWIRCVADLDNYRKRMQKEKIEWREFYHEEILEEILPVLDNFDRALMTKLENEETKKFAEGIILVDKQLHEILSKHGLVEIESVGKPFNPHFHEAVMTIETDEYPENTVVEELRKGYQREDKVIRPAMVKVSKAKSE